MNQNDQEEIINEWGDNGLPSTNSPTRKTPKISIGILCSVVLVAIAISVLLTYTLTANSERTYYNQILLEQQEQFNQILEDNLISNDLEYSKFAMLAEMLERFSFYYDEIEEEELLKLVVGAYADAVGDRYAEYYTEEEYQKLSSENAGQHQGIGVSVVQTVLEIDNISYEVFQIIAIFNNSPAEKSSLRVGDFIYAIKESEETKTIAQLGGYTEALSKIRGEKGTFAEFSVFRKADEGYQSIDFSIERDDYEKSTIIYSICELDPSVGYIHISQFDLTTPVQFKDAVFNLQKSGIKKFIFDVRNNPGGDLQSIKAVMSYFLQKGDLILSTVDKNGSVSKSYYAEPMTLKGAYAGCNVSESEIGMYSDLDMVVICNENTASAAEVFTATLRDYELATIVGSTTYGKGIMQTFFSMSMFGDYDGYVKMTSYAYLTKCGITYHDIGIVPHVEATLTEEAKQYNFYLLPQEKDDQLITAIKQFQ